jgi:transcriptional regulator with XRE-family HTH domain
MAQDDHIQQLGKLLKTKRETLGLSIREVAKKADLMPSTVIRFEQAQRATPRPDALAKLAPVLEIPLSELYALAGYAVAEDLPSMPAYLRLKYRDLPEPAREELTRYWQMLEERYGLDKHGPQNGEDES